MADMRTTQNLAQVEWQETSIVRTTQNLAQVEWQETSIVRTTQNLVQVEYSDTPPGWSGKLNGITNPGKINGVSITNISKVMGQ